MRVLYLRVLYFVLFYVFYFFYYVVYMCVYMYTWCAPSFDDHAIDIIVTMSVLLGRLRPIIRALFLSVVFLSELSTVASTTPTQHHDSPHGRRPWAPTLFQRWSCQCHFHVFLLARPLVYSRNKKNKTNIKKKRQGQHGTFTRGTIGLKGLEFESWIIVHPKSKGTDDVDNNGTFCLKKIHCSLVPAVVRSSFNEIGRRARLKTSRACQQAFILPHQ